MLLVSFNIIELELSDPENESFNDEQEKHHSPIISGTLDETDLISNDYIGGTGVEIPTYLNKYCQI